MNHFDTEGRLVRWPTKNAIQKLVVWAFWADLDAGESLSEAEINKRFYAEHHFGDPATIRRMLVGLQRVERARDGSAYTRVELPVAAEAEELIRRVRDRRRTRTAHHPGPISPTS